MNHEIFDDKNVKKITLQSMDREGIFSEDEMMYHLQTPPQSTVIRVNTVITDPISLKEELNASLQIQYSAKEFLCPTVELHPLLNDVLIIKAIKDSRKVMPNYPIVVVGLQCGVAVLRGSQVYAPGVLAIPYGVNVGAMVSIYADLKGQCKRGFAQEYQGPTYFVGNGLLTKNRRDIFTEDLPKGIAVNMVEPLYDSPSIGDILLEPETGLNKGFLQNLPSVICGHLLNPDRRHAVLDMCAAPGGKTTHMATLMNGEGTVIAIDKSETKIQQIRANAQKLGLNNIRAFVSDSVKIVAERSQISDENFEARPPFAQGSFDRILLDAPCSALGQRPQLYNPLKLKVLESFPRLQRKLFISAVELLKLGGRIVYSTCTYNVAENEEIVSWALNKYPFLELVEPHIKIGQPGYQVDGLSEMQCAAMQRFGPSHSTGSDCDSIGFFLCCLEKRAI